MASKNSNLFKMLCAGIDSNDVLHVNIYVSESCANQVIPGGRLACFLHYHLRS